ncbi:MAG: AbrB/MazE/SpoVT family DNA-binding domain-containing protein [Chloroflexi bacterium]|jgi:bifunctional DNA-binding transcriptional regulator/antitoxin component of YhaV-PrlF toxin-antitoxin module|nr:AbrB/MazE/SpoVT family DNA-binding domain-containing protein [Chloroflexota bacterium]
MNGRVKHTRRRGYTRVSAKHQVTIPIDALAQAGLRAGDRLRAEVRGPGEVVLVREDDPLTR